MQAVILAGGLGTRLRSVNAAVPKPMIEVAGKPFLAHLMNMLIRRGLSDFLLLLGHKSEVVLDYVGSCVFPNCRIAWSVEPSPLGTGGAFKWAESQIAQEFFYINGDTYLDIDYAEVASQFRTSDATGMMVVYDNCEHTDVINNVALNEEGRVAHYKKDALDAPLTHVEAGVLAFRKKVLDLLPPAGQVSSFENEIYGRLIERGDLASFVTRRRFYDIGTPSRLKEFEGVLYASGAARRGAEG